MSIPAFIKDHSLWTFFIVTFAISWGGLLLVIGGPAGITGASGQFDALLPFVIMALLAGPSTAGLLLSGLIGGREGLRGFLSRLIRWRVGARWYAIALFAAPFLFMAILLVLFLFSSKFLPGILAAKDKSSHLIMGLATGLMAGVFEELGWTGFATPSLRRRFGVFSTGLILGIVWAIWHLLPAFWLGFASGTIRGTLSFISYLLDPFLFLVVFRILIVWVCDRTGSLFVAVLMHISLTSSSRIFMPLGIVGMPLLAFDLAWATLMWIIVAKIAIGDKKRFVEETP